jgi:hypothetical protein
MWAKMIEITTVQECDANEGEQGTTADNPKITPSLPNYYHLATMLYFCSNF